MTQARIDVHHHYLTTELIEALDEVGIRDVGGQPLAEARPADSLAVMDRYEIAAALLSVPVPLAVRDPRGVARSLNEAGAAAVAEAPGRLGLLAALPLPDVDGALEELAYALDTLGADGILLLSNHEGVYLGEDRMEAIFAELDRRSAVAFVHPAAHRTPVALLQPSLFEFPFDTTRAVADLVVSGMLERHPGVDVVVAHAGGTVPYLHDRIVDRRPILARVAEGPPPSTEEIGRMLSAGLASSHRQLERLFYDLTLSANETVLGCLEQLAPTSHILFGTDYPFAQEIGITQTLAGIERHDGFDAAAQRAIESENASRLFPRLLDQDRRFRRCRARDAAVPSADCRSANGGAR